MIRKLEAYFIVIIKFLLLVNLVAMRSSGMLSCQYPQAGLFEDISVSSFIDENRYIRLNISWSKPKANFSNFEMMIDTNCSALYGERNISVEQKYVIQPSIDRLRHPAEPLLHGCKYDFELISEIEIGNRSCAISEAVDYTIPECVEEVCECGIANAPYEYKDLMLVKEHIYTIQFMKTDRTTGLSLEAVFDKVWYTNINSNKTLSIIQPGQISFDNAENTITLPFNEFHSGNSYIVNIDLSLDNCEYHFSTKVQVPKGMEIYRSSSYPFFLYLTILFTLCVIITFVVLKTKSLLLEKLRKFVSFAPYTITATYSAETSGVVSRSMKEVINSQYTPLEFLLNADKFDHFEIPRNKIILKNEIGGGAFGKVFRAEVHKLNSQSGYVFAAAKKPIENAPEEEIADFLAEIEMMKKIQSFGGHRNVIKLLACVTIDPPHLMVMELVPCGSLKSYLNNLRKKWEEKKTQLQDRKARRHFFPDNMIVEHYLPSVTVSSVCGKEKLKYSDLAFDDRSDGTYNSEETNSYITPDTPRTPSSSGSPCALPVRKIPDRRKMRQTKNEEVNIMDPTCLAPQSPATPNSVDSSGLPSGTETLLTPLDSTPVTPIIDISEDTSEKIKPALDSEELQSFALQIASGMAFLESIHVTHRDLAARNILISKNKVLKISDFGMARIGVYVNTTKKRQPLRWMAPEAIECRRCDNKTDVWSFGVVLWEIGSLGAFPYKHLSNEMVIGYILQGKRLERPETCTDPVYELMQQCWQKNADDRPRFEDIVKQLDISNGKIYVDFSKLSLKYIFPPTQDDLK